MQDCKDAGKKLLELIWVDTDKSVDPADKTIRSRLCARELQDEETIQDSKSLSSFSVVLCNATTRSCESVGLNHDVCELVEQRKTIEGETLRHQPSTFPRNSPESHLHPTSNRRSSE